MLNMRGHSAVLDLNLEFVRSQPITQSLAVSHSLLGMIMHYALDVLFIIFKSTLDIFYLIMYV